MPVQIISRALCFYKNFQLSDLPDKERKTGLKLMIRRWSPFSDYQTWTIMHQDYAQVWIWDKEIAQKVQIIPETLFQAPPEQASMRLISCLDGVEIQYWADKETLLESHWWAEYPTQCQLQRFMLSLPADAVQPQDLSPMTIPLSDSPWNRNDSSGVLQWSQQNKLKLIYPAIALISYFAFSIGFNLYSRQQQYQQLDSQIDALTEKISPILAFRNSAQEDSYVVSELSAIMPEISQLTLMAEFSKLFDKKREVQIISWDYNNDRLITEFYIDHFQAQELVALIQQNTYFQDVRLDKNNKTNAIKAHIRLAH